MDSTSPNQLAFNIWKHSNWLPPERNVKFLLLLNFRPHAAAFIRCNYKIKYLSIIYQRYGIIIYAIPFVYN